MPIVKSTRQPGRSESPVSFPIRTISFARADTDASASPHGTVTGALLVPQRAVTELQGSYQVAVVSSDNKVSIRPVTVGDRVGKLWIVTDGLKAGERVVVEGLLKVRDGAVVNVGRRQVSAGRRLTCRSSSSIARSSPS